MKLVQKMISPVALVAVVSAFALATPFLDRHPDGAANAYRAWGPTTVSQDGYSCSLYALTGSRVGSFSSGFTGRVDVYVGNKEAHFTLDPMGFFNFYPLDEATFPDLANVPPEYKTDGHMIMTFEARVEPGVNGHIAAPITRYAQSITSAEARCVYIVDETGLPLFCMNCLYVIAQSDD